MATAWVVHASASGATRAVAEAVAEVLSLRLEVELHEVAPARGLPSGVGLLVLGGSASAVREWPDLLDPNRPPLVFAAFETRVRRLRGGGSAAKQTASALRRLGHTEIAAAASFWVHATQEVLLDAELDRARAWARDLADVVGGPGQAYGPVALP